MVLLIDTNVLLDYLLIRQPQFNDSARVISACQKGIITGYIAFHSLSILWYTLRKKSDSERRQFLLQLTSFLRVASASHEKVVDAIQQVTFPDFEDCLQEKCAMEINADFIVTNNTKDFTSSKIQVVTPTEMLELFFKLKTEPHQVPQLP